MIGSLEKLAMSFGEMCEFSDIKVNIDKSGGVYKWIVRMGKGEEGRLGRGIVYILESVKKEWM